MTVLRNLALLAAASLAACQSDIAADDHTFACATTTECGGGKVCSGGICVNPLGLSDTLADAAVAGDGAADTAAGN